MRNYVCSASVFLSATYSRCLTANVYVTYKYAHLYSYNVYAASNNNAVPVWSLALSALT